MTARVDGVATGLWMFPDRPAPQLVDVARHVDAAGMAELWLGDEGPAREPFAVLAAAAGVTERIRLCVGVTNPYVRHPALAASTMLTVHELSGGRAVLGVGAGGQMSLGPFGLRPERPLAAVRDFVATVRAVALGRVSERYRPTDIAVTETVVGAPLPVFVGARGEHLNRLASRVADGAFVAGMPPFRFGEVLAWVRSHRPIDVALYPSAAMSEEAVERHRPEMIWSLADAPGAVRAAVGVGDAEVQAAAVALRGGDPGPARRIVDDEVLAELMLVGDPGEVGRRLAGLVGEHRPTSVGLAVMQEDLHAAVEAAGLAFDAMRRHLGASP